MSPADAPSVDLNICHRTIAYFSMEIALSPALPTYSGGAQDDAAATAFINGRFGNGANGVASSDGSSAWSGVGTACP